ncbi:MAG TPA: hypothetical protein ENG70_05585 [Candidatus Cloacimonetes bacterium]|nr:hypothetical protein [Candidatus Cloacimonadota bacterium]HEX38305.1 hypothetical protein [Candidatus Cloacimonadota bacterium]
MNKRLMKIVLIGVTVVFLAGCFNITQHISKDGDKLNVFIKFSVSKSIFEMSKSMGGKSDENPCEEIYTFNEKQIIETFPKSFKADCKKVDTELECGYEMYLTIDTNSKDYKKMKKDDAPAFIPFIDKKEIYIAFPHDDEEEEEDQMAAGFMSSAVYKLTLNRNVVEKVKSISFLNADETFDVSFVELSDIYIIEVPLAYWISSSSDCSLVIKY